MENNDSNEDDHHTQQNLCKTRPAYRQGRKLTAVKVYTVNSESQHLFIYGVPSINLRNELKSLCIKYGRLMNIHVVQDRATELFTECYHVQYERIQSARIAKRLMDNKSFYGGILHVCYVPECESLEETRNKLFQRVKDVRSRVEETDQAYFGRRNKVKFEEFADISKSQIRKRKREGTLQEEHLSYKNKQFKEAASGSGYTG